LQALSFLATNTATASGTRVINAAAHDNDSVEYGSTVLPRGVRSRRVDTNNGVVLHILEAGFDGPRKPCVVLLHGFPELAYCWRNQLLPLASAGFHVVAPDLRGYGLSASKAVTFDDELLPYSMLNRVGDVLGLVRALGYEKVSSVVGHDWGGPTAQWCARLRPEVFQSVVSMSTPFLDASGLPLGTADRNPTAAPEVDQDLRRAPQGIHDLLRQWYYFKSADWKGNKPFPLNAWTALELAKMPAYYIMDLDKGIAATMAEHQPQPAEIATCKWMTEADLQVYATQFTRTGFQGGLNYYRVELDPGLDGELNAFAEKTIDVPACYIGGSSEWAVYQSPGSFQRMRSVCTRLKGVHLVPAAGHSIAEEQPEALNRLLINFFADSRRS